MLHQNYMLKSYTKKILKSNWFSNDIRSVNLKINFYVCYCYDCYVLYDCFVL